MNIFLALLQALFGPRDVPVVIDERVPYAENPLVGMPMDYLIGTDSPPSGVSGRIIEVGYDVNVPRKHGISIAYCNLFDEKNTGKLGPYLHDSDTAADYDEGQIDPRGSGWMKNLSSQFKRRKDAGFKYIELDNPDAYKTADVNGAVSIAAQYGLCVIAKNVSICDDPISYLKHANVYGVICEKGADDPIEMEQLRIKAGRHLLPVWFVYFGGVRSRARETAKMIQLYDYKNMGVTYSSRGEYGSSEDILLPTV